MVFQFLIDLANYKDDKYVCVTFESKESVWNNQELLSWVNTTTKAFMHFCSQQLCKQTHIFVVPALVLTLKPRKRGPSHP